VALIRILFLLISGLGLAMAAGTVLARNLVHAALFLVGFFFVIACEYVLLEAEFLAVVQVLIYIGAVAILLLFGIMLTRNIQGDETTTVSWPTRAPAMVAGLAILAILAYGIAEQKAPNNGLSWSQMTARPALAGPAQEKYDPNTRTGGINDMARTVGYEMMTRYVIAFEVAGLLLTAAVVGAIALAQLEGAAAPPSDRSETATPATAGGNGHPAAPVPAPPAIAAASTSKTP
jgi:NADH-quinone oxidoreductase subunit J